MRTNVSTRLSRPPVDGEARHGPRSSGEWQRMVAALETALINGRPESASDYFEVARRLESWRLLDQARGFAERASTKPEPTCWRNADYHPGARVFARIMTRLRQQGQALKTSQKALTDSSANLRFLRSRFRRGSLRHYRRPWRENRRRVRMDTGRRDGGSLGRNGYDRDHLLYSRGASGLAAR